MNENEADRLFFDQLMNEPDARIELDRAWQILDESIAQSKFNRERAEEIFSFVVDNCAHRFFRSYPGGAAILFPKTIRKPFALELTQEFIRSRNGVESQRPARKSLLRYVFGR